MKRRNTINKKRILDIFEKKHALTVRELGKLLPDIDKSVLYRNVERFVKDNVLRQVYINPKIIAFERINEEHDHFVCDNCYNVQGINNVNSIIKDILPKGVSVSRGGVVIHGTCKKCSIVN